MKEQLTNTTEVLERPTTEINEDTETWSDAEAEQKIDELVKKFTEQTKREKAAIEKSTMVSHQLSKVAWLKVKGQQTIDGITTSIRNLQDSVIGTLEKNKLYQKVVVGDEKYREQLAGKTEQLFGDSITITEAKEYIVSKHLEHLNLLPEHFVNHLKKKGMRVRVGNSDVIELTQDKSYEEAGPRGWENTASWKGVPGCFDLDTNTVIAGKGDHGCTSLALHEYGHGVGNILGLDFSDELVTAHKRLHPKLNSYLQQDGPGGHAGRQELLAESFGDFHIKSKADFIKNYDEAWHNALSEIIRAPKDDYMNRANI